MFHRWVRRRLARDAGFSIVEIAVAGGVVATALTMLAGVVTSGLTTTGYARERQSANQLANQSLEQVRSLPFLTVQQGLQGAAPADDLITHPDSNINAIGCGSSYCFGGERIVMHTGGSNVDPLVPHRKSLVVGPTTFTVSTYVTNYKNDTASGALRVTVYVTWPSLLKSTTGAVQAQTVVFAKCMSTNTCQTLGTHPFPGPTLPTFTTTANQASSTASISGTIGGVGLDHATLWSGRAISDATIEQVSHVQGTSQASGVSSQLTDGTEQTAGRTSVSSKADSDPALGTPPVYSTASLTSTAAASLSVALNSYQLSLSSTGGATGTTTSTTSSCTATCSEPVTPSPRNCPNLSGYANENDLLHCGGSSATDSSTLSAQASLGTLGTMNLAAAAPQMTPTTSIVDRKTSLGGTTCVSMPAAPTDGCVRSSVTRNGVDLSAGALPSNLNVLLKPLGFTYFAQITGLTDTVAAEAGPGAGVPTATQSAGSVRVYCATAILGHLLCPVTGYVTKTLNQITSAVTTPTLTITDLTWAGGTTITLSATVTPGSTNVTSTGSPIATANATSKPLTVSVAYKIVSGGTTVIDTTIVLDPGAITAATSYVPAQS